MPAYDSRLPGFTLRVQPTGVRSSYARFGRNRRFALGKVGTLRPDEARDKCQKVLRNSPAWMVDSLDREARRMGVTRQSLIKLWLADKLCQKAAAGNRRS